MKREAETGVKHLQVKESQGTPGTTGAQGGRTHQGGPTRNHQQEGPSRHLDFELVAPGHGRINSRVFGHQVDHTCYSGR